ncbi:TRAP transporter large permease subunit [Elioraea sp.]|uniref:TRAP transporter large permease n=1 Tax=Elioraea sp. TaxID=2185103 RepID=UPI0025C1824E|nr:TRAP transporter large permease subunit [Elioraea sp.]
MFIEDLLPAGMFVFLAVFVFCGFPVAGVMAGSAIIFALIGWWYDVFRLVEFYTFWPRIYGQAADNIVLVAVPLFIFMGLMLERSGIAEKLLYCLQVLLRRVPGGLALAVILMGTILAATTGIVGASVVMLSLLALPMMVNQGYDKRLSTGVIAASGTLGILIPPSIMLVIMGDLMNLSVGVLFVAAIVPGLLLAVLYVVYVLAVCWWNPALAPPLAAGEGPRGMALVRLVVEGLVPPTALIVFVLGSIFGGFATPTEASGVGALGATLLAWANGRLTLPTLRSVLDASAVTIGMVFMLIVAATCFAYVFRSLGGDDLVRDAMQAMPVGDWGILVGIMVIVFLLGIYLDWIEILLIVLPVFYTIFQNLDLGGHVAKNEQMFWFAILLAVNLQNSFLSPPFGATLFYLKGTAPKSVTLGDIYWGVTPFMVLQVIGLALIIAFPDIVLYLPRGMLD